MMKIKKALFDDIIQKHHPEKLVHNPTIVEIVGNNVVFEMENHEGRYCINLRGLEEFTYQYFKA